MTYADRLFEEHPRPAEPAAPGAERPATGAAMDAPGTDPPAPGAAMDAPGADLPELDDWVFATAGTLVGFGLVAAGLTAGLVWLAGPAAVLALLPAYALLLAGATIRVRIDERGLRVHALSFLPVTGLKLRELDYAATGEAKVPFLGGVVLKSGAALSAGHGGALEHAIIRNGPALVATGPYRLKVVVSAASSAHARSMAELLSAYQTRARA